MTADNFQENEIAIEVVRDFERRSGTRGIWEDYWQEISDLVEPSMGNNIRFGDVNVPGERNFDKQMDSEPTRALSKFAAILDSLLTPRGSMWHRLIPSDRVLLKDQAVKEWFEEATNILFQHRYSPEANFSSQNQLVYRGLGSFGSSSMFIDKLDTGRGIRYRNVHIGETYWEQNHQGIVNNVIRRFRLTAQQLVRVELWKDSIDAELLKDAAANPNKKFTVLHRVRPRGDFEAAAFDERAMPFESEYVLLEKRRHLHSGGFRSFPYATTRYEQAPNEVYGRSPAMQVFASIRSLMVEKKAVLKSAHRNVDPIILVSDDNVLQNVSLRPGTVVPGAVSPDGRPLAVPFPAGDPNIGVDLMNQEKEDIRDAFLIRLFQILQDNPRMTATEVLERAREKGMLLAPTIGRQESEYLGPLILRELEVLNQQGLLPDQPPALVEAKGEFTIIYDSPLSKVARAEEAAGFQRTLEILIPVMNLTGDFSPLDNFDMDIIARSLSDSQAVPSSWNREADVVAQVRQSRAEQQQQQEAATMAPDLLKGVAAAKKAGVTEEDLQ